MLLNTPLQFPLLIKNTTANDVTLPAIGDFDGVLKANSFVPFANDSIPINVAAEMVRRAAANAGVNCYLKGVPVIPFNPAIIDVAIVDKISF